MQKQVLNFIKAVVPLIQRFPTTREMQLYFGWSSQTSAIVHLRALEKKGHIHRAGTKTRTFFKLTNYTLKLIPKNKMTESGYNRIREITKELLDEKNKNFHTDPLVIKKFKRIKEICDEETFDVEGVEE